MANFSDLTQFSQLEMELTEFTNRYVWLQSAYPSSLKDDQGNKRTYTENQL